MSDLPIAPVSPPSYKPSNGLIQNLVFLQEKKIPMAFIVAFFAPSPAHSVLYGSLVYLTAVLPFWTTPVWTPTLAPHKFTALVFFVSTLLNIATTLVFGTQKEDAPDTLLRTVLLVSVLNLLRGFLANQIKFSQAYFTKRLYPENLQSKTSKYAFLWAFAYPFVLDMGFSVIFNLAILPKDKIQLFSYSSTTVDIYSIATIAHVTARVSLNLYFAADLFFNYPTETETELVAWNDESKDFYSFANLGYVYPWYFFLQYL